jgi:hypothetical protein
VIFFAVSIFALRYCAILPLFSAGISKVSIAASSASKRPDTLGTSFSGNTISAPNASASTVKSIITVAAAEGYLSQSALIAS